MSKNYTIIRVHNYAISGDQFYRQQEIYYLPAPVSTVKGTADSYINHHCASHIMHNKITAICYDANIGCYQFYYT